MNLVNSVQIFRNLHLGFLQVYVCARRLQASCSLAPSLTFTETLRLVTMPKPSVSQAVFSPIYSLLRFTIVVSITPLSVVFINVGRLKGRCYRKSVPTAFCSVCRNRTGMERTSARIRFSCPRGQGTAIPVPLFPEHFAHLKVDKRIAQAHKAVEVVRLFRHI